MKHKLLILFSIFFINIVFSQPYGNEWIDYNQPHFKIEVAQEGIYRINNAAINQYGLNFIDAANFKIFRDGEEVPLYVNQTNTVANYIEFYAYPNDGKLDTRLYKDPEWQMHDRYSLFDDKAIYYLTWNNTGNNLRINSLTNDLTNLPVKEPYFYAISQNILNNSFSIGKPNYLGSTGLYNSIFDEGEGFYSSSQFNNSTNSQSYNLATPYAISGQNAELYTVAVSWTNGNHHFNIQSGSTVLSNHQFSEYAITKTTNTIPAAQVGNTTNVTFRAINTSGSTNRNNPALIEIKYARDFDFDNQSSFVFNVESNNQKQYLEISNFEDQNTYPVLYDLTNGYRIVAIDAPGASNYRFALPPATGNRKLILRANNAANYTEISSLDQIDFINYSNFSNQGDYILLTNSFFINLNQINNYVAHRESFIGGGHDVVKVDIDQLYLQFGYGVDRHPQAIRNFVAFANNTWTKDPKHLFIVGKAREYKSFRTSATVRAKCVVPTFGNPGSDILLAANTTSAVPQIAIGRLAVINSTHIEDYLEKIIEYDNSFYNYGDPYQTIANKDYLKQIIHLGGGVDQGEQTTFRNYLNSYASMASDTSWGAVTHSIFKNSSAPIQTIPSQFIKERINEGVSLITFFGHSYAGGFDISFDEPENYTNTGKYPVFLANGCNSGLIHVGTPSISERFVLQKQKGAIAYLSTTDLSSSSSLNIYTSNFYRSLSEDNYATSLGEIIQKTITEVELCCSSSVVNMMVAQEMTLHGDPAIPFNQYREPDYDIEAQNVFFTPNNVSTSLDSFEINLDVYNLGKAIKDSFNVEVSRIYPNGNQTVVVNRFPAPYYRDTLTLKLAVNGDYSGLGLNNFNIYIDVDDEIPNELSETNNYLLNSIQLFIGSDDIFPIYPYEFAIVPNQNVTLKSSTGNPFENEKWYVYQIDTSELFNSPLAEERIYSAGGVVPWTPPITMTDSTVYYWRVSSDSIYSGNFKWQYSSYIYLDGEYPGWNQSHYYQWQKDSYQTVYLDTDREFKFIDIPREVNIQTGVYPNLFYEEMKWVLDGAKMHNWRMNICGGGVGFPNGISIALIDNVTGNPVPVVNNSSTSSYGPDGNIHCVGLENTVTVANFRATGNTPSNHPTPGVPWSSLILDYLNNVPDDFYVMVYTVNNPNFSGWNPSLTNYFNNLGLSVSSSSASPFIFVYQKNNLSFSPISNIGSNFNDIISTDFQINGTWVSGDFKSPPIGPAQEWGSFHWDYDAKENPTQDEQSVSVFGINSTNQEVLLFTVPSVTLDTAINFIDAQNYPYLRLKLNTLDDVNRTPTQTKFWRVLYKKPPEAAINPNKFFSVNKDTLVQGETWKMSVAIENVTERDMDSLTVKNSFTTSNNNLEISYGKNDSLIGFDTLHLNISKNTIDNVYKGLNNLTIEANPYEQDYQLEQFHFNNFANFDFFIQSDNINPLLDVSFDGIKILDGDLVSAKPEIELILKDENQFLALDDTSLINIYFRYLGPDGSSPGALTRVSFNDINTQFIAANSSKNVAKVVMQKEFINDGFYEILIRSRDKSGNSSSGTEDRLTDQVYYDYRLSFLVENQSRISNVLNYPNPFTTRTQFIFTLTGSEIPSYFEIQIMNIKGTVVKQITQEEMGSIHIGLNKTDYWWDGKDEYGDALANGVYFYKIITAIDNEEIDHFGIDQVDKYFKKGIGKMVLIR